MMTNTGLTTQEYWFLFRDLAVALSLGFLIGLERGWSKRELETGKRIAGVRTFGLISLLGALTVLLGHESTGWILTVVFGGLGLLVAAATTIESYKTGEYGITTEVAAFIAFILGALAMTPYTKLAAAAAVITTTILGTKPFLHAWIRTLEPKEIHAVFKLLLISVVLLPILPNRTYDPWQAFNPYEIWWMVVLISAISFIGYFAVKLIGPSRGILLTGFFGGLASSTAVALSLSRLARDTGTGQRLLAAGVIVASSTMFPRVLVVAALFRPSLAEILFRPLLTIALIGYLGVWWLVRREATYAPGSVLQLENPFEFGTALRFGALLAIVIWLTNTLKKWLGTAGIYLTAAVSGITDVDAITLSLANLAEETAMQEVAAVGIVLAALVNTLVKGGLTAAIAGKAMARYVCGIFLLQTLVGILVFVIEQQT